MRRGADSGGMEESREVEGGLKIRLGKGGLGGRLQIKYGRGEPR